MNPSNASIKTKQVGVSMIETLIVTPIFLLIGLGFVHLGMVFQAQSNLEYAALMAARIGASTNINVQAMEQEVLRRMAPSQFVSDQGALPVVVVDVLNPTVAMFDGCGVTPTYNPDNCAGANCEIPYFGLQFRNNAAVCGGVSIKDANILRIRVSYPYDSKIPFISRIKLIGEDAAPNQSPGSVLTAVATVRMQSAPRLTINNQAFISLN
jgi:Tfp pilus assembly protein PilV